jgi:hypothetical protein
MDNHYLGCPRYIDCGVYAKSDTLTLNWDRLVFFVYGMFFGEFVAAGILSAYLLWS